VSDSISRSVALAKVLSNRHEANHKQLVTIAARTFPKPESTQALYTFINITMAAGSMVSLDKHPMSSRAHHQIQGCYFIRVSSMNPLHQQGQVIIQFFIAHHQDHVARLHSKTVDQDLRELIALHERIQAEGVGQTNEVVPHDEVAVGHRHDRRASKCKFKREALFKQLH
jgi:hypothetical protein